ncbi:MAG: ExbD/TolR family protein [Thermogutta sp.]
MRTIICEYCGTAIATAEAVVGKEMVCPKCGQTVHTMSQSGNNLPSVDSQTADNASDGTMVFERVEVPEDAMDMTPMVDVVFQLLIFFMMTAAFSLQKSLELPPSSPQDPTAQSMTLDELDNESDFVIVRIDHKNNVTVDGEDAPSEQEVLRKLKDAKSGSLRQGEPPRTGLLILADPDCHHETVVMVLDAGNATGMERVRLATVEDTMF